MSVAHKSFEANKDLLQAKREESAKKTFKQVLKDLTVILQNATDTDTTILYWINKERELFVLENYTTVHEQTIFQDRVAFESLFLKEFINITEPVQLEVGNHIAASELTHYYKDVPVRFITLLPFVNNGETVALTVLESRYSNWDKDMEKSVEAYSSALINLLQTYLQLTGLSDEQEQWLEYEESLENLLETTETVGLLLQSCNELQALLQHGGVSLLCRGMGEWNVVANSKYAQLALPLGMSVAEQSIAWNALQSGKAEFSIHFNANPKRVSPRENGSNGATLAIPVLIKGRRQAVFVISDDNPLVFNEATRHKMINLVRMLSLKLENNERNLKVTEDILSTENTAYDISLLEEVLSVESKRQHIFGKNEVWAGFITLANLQELRTRLRLEELKSLQKQIISVINPQKLGSLGYLANYSDFVYAFVLETKSDANPVEAWAREIEALFDRPFLFNNHELSLDFHIGCTKVDAKTNDGYLTLQKSKQALSLAVKNPQEIIVIAKED